MFCTAPEAMVLAEAGDGGHSMGNTREQDCCFQQQPAFTLSSIDDQIVPWFSPIVSRL